MFFGIGDCTNILVAKKAAGVGEYYTVAQFLGSVTLKKGTKYGLQKVGCKKQGHCYSKRGKSVDETNLLQHGD